MQSTVFTSSPTRLTLHRVILFGFFSTIKQVAIARWGIKYLKKNARESVGVGIVDADDWNQNQTSRWPELQYRRHG